MDQPERIIPMELEGRLERAWDFAARQVRGTIERLPDYFPIYTENGRWQHGGELWTDWCGGFHAGMMWLLAGRSDDDFWTDHAEHYSRLLEYRQHDRNVHDLGFVFLNSYRPWYKESGDESLNEVLITAGKTMALRFNEKGQYLRSFMGPESLFIDIMMNVPIIFYAARETRDEELKRIAKAHCRTTERTLVREDGSTAHEGIFDLETGAFLRQSTQQGVGAESRWTRGLAWSLYGFTTVYGYTQDRVDLEVAVRNADCFLDSAPAGLVPPWDFDAPEGPGRIPDSSAGAIAASGLWDLADECEQVFPDRARRYRAATLTILGSLCTDQYMAWNTPGWEGVLLHGVYHIHKGLGVDESVMWGDFFFLEAIDKVLTARDDAD